MLKKETLTKTPVVCLLAIFCCFLWGSAFPCIKIGYRLFAIAASDTASQLLFAGIRFILAGILVILAASISGRHFLKPQKSALKPILSLAMVQTFIQYLFFYVGLAHTTGVKSSIIEASNVFISILIASVIFRYEKFTLAKCIGCLIGFAGVVIINLSGGSLDSSFTLAGEGAILLSAVSYAFSSVLIKKFSATHNPVLLSAYQFLAGGILLSLCGIAAGGHLDRISAASIGLLLYMAFISAAAYTIWGILLKHNPISRVAVFGFSNPVFGVLLSALFLQEDNQAFTLVGVFSLILVSIGIFIVNRAPAKEKQITS